MKNVNQLRDGKEFLRRCEQNGWESRQNGGSHAVVTAPNGEAVCIPIHGELGKGIRCKITKRLLQLGLVLIPMLFGYIVCVN